MLTESHHKICKIWTVTMQSRKPRLLLILRWTQRTPESCAFPGSKTYPMESIHSSVYSASELYKQRDNTLGGNTSCQISGLTFACPQTVTRAYLKIKLLGKHMTLSVTNANGVVTNAETDLSAPPKACKTICAQSMRQESFPRMSF